eukprot:1157368-Pelagomonas_calceolata.AAC.1
MACSSMMAPTCGWMHATYVAPVEVGLALRVHHPSFRAAGVRFYLASSWDGDSEVSIPVGKAQNSAAAKDGKEGPQHTVSMGLHESCYKERLLSYCQLAIGNAAHKAAQKAGRKSTARTLPVGCPSWLTAAITITANVLQKSAAGLRRAWRIHGCANHGLAIFGPMDLEAPLDMAGGGSVKLCSKGHGRVSFLSHLPVRSLVAGAAGNENCTIEQNKGDGIRVRTSAEPMVSGNIVQENKGNGVALKDCGGRYIKNTISKNNKGGFVAEGYYGVANGAKIAQENKVDGAVRIA